MTCQDLNHFSSYPEVREDLASGLTTDGSTKHPYSDVCHRHLERQGGEAGAEDDVAADVLNHLGPTKMRMINNKKL
jgi:hypothetical protein